MLDKEINKIVDFIAAKAKPKFEAELAQKLTRGARCPDNEASDEDEELLEQCIEVIRQSNRASVSVLQRRLASATPARRGSWIYWKNAASSGPSRGPSRARS